MEQVRIDFLVTGNMSSLTGQVQGLNAQLMQSAAAANALGRSFNNMDIQAANRQFASMLTNSNQFDARMVSMRSNVDSFADGLTRAKLSGRQYFTESINYMRKQSSMITELAKQQVRMQNSVMQPLGRDASGKMMANVFTPTGLPNDMATKLQVTNKAWEVFNHTAQQGANAMINWGKNTQWAGRQLMVGFTVPMAMLGGLAAKTFKDLDEELVRLQKVYGSGLTFGDDFQEQAMMIRESAINMSKEMAKAYGVAATDTAALMADLASAGYEGQQLQDLTRDTTKLSVLGEVDRQEAMKATVALQTAFGHSTQQVSDDVLFLNAVENQTSATLGDMVEAIPRAGTVIKGLGGDVQDLAMYMVAMREGGISAAEGANALKSGLSSIISPANEAVEFMKEFGINLPKIVTEHQGDLTGTLMAFQKELQGLDDLARQQVITKLFGKYQFARMNALFNNLGAQGSQTQKVLELMGYSMEDLGQIADQELGQKAESVSGKWSRTWESFKVNIADVGETMLKWGTMLLGVFNSIFGFLDDNEWAMNLVKYGGLALAVIGPIVMTMGLLGNMFGMLTKGVLRLVNAGKVMMSGGGIAKSFQMMTAETFAADSALEKYNTNLFDADKAMSVVQQAVMELKAAYEGLGASVVETGNQMVGAMERVEASSIAAATWAPGTTARPGWTASGVPMQRSHFIPRNIEDPQMQAMANQIFGVTPGVSSTGAKETFNFQKYGWGFTSLDANRAGGSQMPFFAQARPTANPQQMNAAYDINKWMAIQEKLLQQDGVTQEKINAWKAMTLKDAEMAAANSKDILAAERSYMVAMRRLADLAGIKISTIGVDSNYTSPTRDQTRIRTQPGGLEDSPAMFDIMDTQGRAAAMDLIGSTEALATQEDRARVQIDAAFQNMGVKMTPAVQKLAAAMAETAAEIGMVQFAEINIAGKRYVAQLDEAGAVIAGSERFVTANNQVRSMNTKQLAVFNAEMAALNAGTAKASTTIAVHGGTVEVDTAATKAHTPAVEVDTAATRAHATTTTTSTASTGIMGKISGKSGMIGAGLMGGSMLGMLMGGDGVVGNMSNLTMMGAGVGGMFGLPGMAIGGALGFLTGAMTEGFKALQDNATREADVAAESWRRAFDEIDISGPIAEELKLGTVKLNIVPSVDAGAGDIGANSPIKYAEAVSSTYEEMIANLKGSTEDAAETMIKRFYDGLVASGADPEKTQKLVNEILFQAGQEDIVYSVAVDIGDISNAKEAKDALTKQLDTLTQEAVDQVNEGGATTNIGAAFASKLNEAFGAGIIPEDKYWKAASRQYGRIGDTVATTYAESFKDAINQEGLDKLEQWGFGQGTMESLLQDLNKLDATQKEALNERFAMWAKRNAGAGNEFAGSLSRVNVVSQIATDAQVEYLAKLRDGNDAILARTAAIQQAHPEMTIEAATLRALAQLQARYNQQVREGALQQDFMTSAMKYADEQNVETKTNIAKLERQQAREMENLQESESDRMDALQESESDRMDALQEAEAQRLEDMQDAAEKRERLMQREIDQATRAYDKQIAQIQRAEEKRQEAQQAEEDRFQRRQEMRNMEISYDEAVANGELYEAARIRMDIRGISQQRRREDAEEKRQNRAERRIRDIEKEKNAKIRAMNKALREEQRANEKAIEAAQEASDAKIEAAQDASEAMIEAAQEASDAAIEAAEKANKQEVKAAEQKNKEIERDQDDSNETMMKMWQALLNGHMRAYNKFAKQLGIDSREQIKIFESMFGEVPNRLKRAIMDGIQQGDWNQISEMLEKAILGKKYKFPNTPGGQNADASSKTPRDHGHGTYSPPGAGMAKGGQVRGAGTGTSDSVRIAASAGEWVVKESSSSMYGPSVMKSVNEGTATIIPGFAEGGLIQGAASGLSKTAARSVGRIARMLAPTKSGTPGTGTTFAAPGGAPSGDIVYWDGEPVDALVAAQLKIAGKLLGNRYTVYQGSYQPETSYSGTTHTDGGVVDTQGSGVFSQEVIDLQKAGFAAWYRGPGAPGAAANYPAHVHAVSLLSNNLDTNAAYQRQHYLDMSGDGISGPYYGPHVQPIKNLRAKLPGLSAGTEFVKYDNTIANLHRGESVLTAPLTKAFKDNVAGGGGDVYDIDVHGPFYKEFDVADAVKKGILEAKREAATRNRGGRTN